MLETALTCAEPLPLPRRSLGRDKDSIWAIVLAGGEGRRLRPLTRQLYGEGRPKQYAALTGSRSPLRQTLARVARVIPPERTVVVSQVTHDRYLAAELCDCPDVHVLAQPADRGTAAAVLLAAHWISARDPKATVAAFPTDHFILEEGLFMGCVAQVVGYVRAHPEWLVLLGVQPTGPETDYGWIEPGERVGWTARGPLYRVRRFEEKPPEELARRLFVRGGLWNTLVFATGVSTLIDAGLECVPLLHDRLVRLRLFIDTEFESWGLRQAYEFAPTADFSRAILESSSVPLAVAQLPSLTWCDLGTPERVAHALRQSASEYARLPLSS